MARRSNELELNFDGLTDSITNLVGALIILVVLLVAITRPASDNRPSPGETRASDVTDSQGEKTAEEMLRQVQTLRQQIQSADREIAAMERRLREAQTRSQSLFDN